jgi:hypothetical protein
MLQHEHDAARRNKGTDVCSQKEQEGNPEEERNVQEKKKRRGTAERLELRENMENIQKRETNDETLFAAAVRRKEELLLKDEEKNTMWNKLYDMNNVEIL